MRFSGFGSVGLQGQWCEVPKPDAALGMYTVAAHDAFCDCMYGSNPTLNARCKVKFDIGKSANLIGMPWTDTPPGCGKAARSLPGASPLCVTAAGLIDKAVDGIGAGIEDLLDGAPPPAGTGGPTNTSTTPVDVRTDWGQPRVGKNLPSVDATSAERLRLRLLALEEAKRLAASSAAVPVPVILGVGGVLVWALFFRKPKS